MIEKTVNYYKAKITYPVLFLRTKKGYCPRMVPLVACPPVFSLCSKSGFRYRYLQITSILLFITLLLPAVVQANMAQINTNSAPVVVVNKGDGGDNTAQGRHRFARDVLAFHPQHLVIYFGINDAVNPHRLVSPEKYKKNIQWMITRARKVGIGHIILITPHPIIASLVRKRHPEGYPYKESLNEHLLKYDRIIRELSKKNHTDLADLRKLVNKHGGIKATKDSMIRNPVNVHIADGIHFTAKGYRLMGEMVTKCFKDKIKPGQTVVCLGDSLTYGPGMKGAGTTFGQSYPADLNDILNTMVGIPAHDRAFPKPRFKPAPGKLLINAGFEDTADGLTPYRWQVYNSSGKYAGTVRWESKGAAKGKHYAHVEATDTRLPAYLIGPRFKISNHTKYHITYLARGQGKMRLQIMEYGNLKGRTVTLSNWKKVSSKWGVISFDYTLKKKVRRIILSFKVRGKVGLDHIMIQPESTARKDR